MKTSLYRINDIKEQASQYRHVEGKHPICVIVLIDIEIDLYLIDIECGVSWSQWGGVSRGQWRGSVGYQFGTDHCFYLMFMDL